MGKQKKVDYFSSLFIQLWIDILLSIPLLWLSFKWGQRLAINGKIERIVDFFFTCSTQFDVIIDIISTKLLFDYYRFTCKHRNEVVSGYQCIYFMLFLVMFGTVIVAHHIKFTITIKKFMMRRRLDKVLGPSHRHLFNFDTSANTRLDKLSEAERTAW